MRQTIRAPFRLVWLAMLVAPVLLVAYAIPTAQPTVSAPLIHADGQHLGITLAADGSLSLNPTAQTPPTGEVGYDRYGMYISPSQPLDAPSTRVTVSYQATTPAGSALRIALRGSSDGERWTSWHTDLSNGQPVTFAQPVRLIQYRAVLLAPVRLSPVLHTVEMQADKASPTYHTFQHEPKQAQEIVAPTYRVYATPQGMVGSRTANGYVIEPNAWFVSLPSWRALCSPGGYEYQVRITYGDRSVVVPVWDVGPWNTRDDYWSVHREQYQDLRRGWPQDHAAYFEKYHGGYAEKGYVRFPTAMDVGDGAWQALGLPDGWYEVDVTFLWLEGDSGLQLLRQLLTPTPASLSLAKRSTMGMPSTK